MLMGKQAINKSIARVSPRNLIEKNEAGAEVRGCQWNDLVFRTGYSQCDICEERQGESLPEGIPESGP